MTCPALRGKVRVRVRPSSSRNNLLRYDEASNTLHVAVQAPPVDNKANLALVKLLSRQFKQPVRLVSGNKSKNKLVQIG